MDRHLFDILWEVYRDVDAKQPIQIVSSYRSPATNAMLRHRSAHSGVARYSQHMLGHAMDFFIPNVPLEQIRFAGLRLQRGGVGFYPTSGSPFVHLDTGSIRHWPRMTHDELARVFPDGRTVHVPADGVPLKGYEVARADIEKRGDGNNAASLPTPANFFAALFRGKQSEEDDEVASTADVDDKPVLAPVKMADTKPAGPIPTPRTKPQIAATLQLASADLQAVQPAKAKPAAPAAANGAEANSAATSDSKPQSPADIINARGFWGELAATPQQVTPAQIAAINARRALASVDSPQPTPAIYQAFAYAPASSSPVDRGNIVAASAPFPRNVHLAQAERNSAPATDINTVVAKGPQDQRAQDHNGAVATSTRLSAGSGNETWMRIMLLAPSAATMSVTILGDTDLSGMRASVLHQAADHRRDGLFGRSDDGPDLRPVFRIGGREARYDAAEDRRDSALNSVATFGFEITSASCCITLAPSFRAGPKDQTRNLEIPGSRGACHRAALRADPVARPGMTTSVPAMTKRAVET
jgi:hypothetical protein